VARSAAIGALLALAVILPGSAAQANPPVGPGQSVTYTYYQDAAHSVTVGGYSYGSCGTNFRWGTTTAYYTIRYVTCGGQ